MTLTMILMQIKPKKKMKQKEKLQVHQKMCLEIMLIQLTMMLLTKSVKPEKQMKSAIQRLAKPVWYLMVLPKPNQQPKNQTWNQKMNRSRQ